MTDKFTPSAKVACPQWAESMLEKLHRLEVKLGNIQESDTATNTEDHTSPMGWHTRSMDELVSASGGPDTGDANPLSASRDDDGSSDLAEAIFDRVCAGLAEEGFSHEQIANIINSRVGAGGRMKYCNAEEVAEALQA